MRYEKTQLGNPHQLTVNQHVFPSASITRFADENGYVSVHLCDQGKTLRLSPKNDLFCAKRTWNQASEQGFMKKIEDAFQPLAARILEGYRRLTLKEHDLVSRFYALCRLRAEARQSPPSDAQLGYALPAGLCDKDKEEILEANGYLFAHGATLPSRHIASIRIQVQIGRMCAPDTSWAVVYSKAVEFIAPDSFCEIGIVPLSPNFCLVANAASGEISDENAIQLNRLAVEKSCKYYFSRDLSKCFI